MMGRLFPEGFDEASTQSLQALLGAVRATGRTNEVKVRSAEGAREFVTSASLFREARATFLLDPLNALGKSARTVGSRAPRTRRCWRSWQARPRASS